jgi:predicted metal-dependent HD superfamily phosphohydrolase
MEDSPLIDEVLDRYRQPLGPHYPRYRGHVYRMYHYTRHLIAGRGGNPDQDDTAIALAAAFHDLRFATDQALDYLPPSIEAAAEHLEALGLSNLAPAVGRMIGFHHKLTPSHFGRKIATNPPFDGKAIASGSPALTVSALRWNELGVSPCSTSTNS